MTDFLGILLAGFDFLAPGLAVWYLVLEPHGGDRARSLVAAAVLSTVLVPGEVFLLNRTLGYPLTASGITTLSLLTVAFSVVWRLGFHKLIDPYLPRLRSALRRLMG